MIEGFYGIDAGTLEVKEGDTISLGAKTLSFYMAPMVHWPETMVTWCAEAGTLFSGDAFGTFGAIDGGITDSQLDPSRYWDEMRRYYACIVGKYGGPVQKALAKVRGLNPTTICSTHGPVWQRQIPQVMDIYDRLSRYEGEPGVVLAYGSMYGNTEQMAERIARELASRGVGPIVIYNLSFADESVVLRDVFRYDTLIVGAPTYQRRHLPARGAPARPDRRSLRSAAQLRVVRIVLLGRGRRARHGRIRAAHEVGADLRSRGDEAGLLVRLPRLLQPVRRRRRRALPPLKKHTPKTHNMKIAVVGTGYVGLVSGGMFRRNGP